MNRPIVVIDDNASHLEYVATLLRRAGFTVEAFAKARKAMEFVQRSDTAVVVTDVFMPDMDGIEVLRFMQRVTPHIGVIGISGIHAAMGSHYLSALRSLGAAAIVEKPLDAAAFLAEVARLYREVSQPDHRNCA